MRAIEAAARAKYEQGDEYYGTWDDLDPVLQEYAISLTTIEIRAYLAALAEDDAAVERIARAIEPHMPVQVKYWQEGNMMRAKLIGPFDPEYVSPEPAARAAIRAMGGE